MSDIVAQLAESRDQLIQAGGEGMVFQFGVHRSVFKEALRVNHLLHGRHRAPFIARNNDAINVVR